MREINTHKRRMARVVIGQQVNGKTGDIDVENATAEQLYEWLAIHGYLWDSELQMWRTRKPYTRQPAKKKQALAEKVLLVRIMGKREVLANEMENFTLAMEVAGYGVLKVQGPLANRGQGFYRVYLKLKVG